MLVGYLVVRALSSGRLDMLHLLSRNWKQFLCVCVCVRPPQSTQPSCISQSDAAPDLLLRRVPEPQQLTVMMTISEIVHKTAVAAVVLRFTRGL